MSNDDFYKATSSLLNGDLLTAEERDTIFDKAEAKGHYRGGFYNSGKYYYANGAGYRYYTFIRISPNGEDAVIFQTNKGREWAKSKGMSNKIYRIITQ